MLAQGGTGSDPVLVNSILSSPFSWCEFISDEYAEDVGTLAEGSRSVVSWWLVETIWGVVVGAKSQGGADCERARSLVVLRANDWIAGGWKDIPVEGALGCVGVL